FRRRASRYASEVAGVLERTGLAHRAAATAAELSHGEKRKLELAVLLVGEPRLMLLDEPMAGVSAEEVPALTELIRTLHREEGRTVLMVEHHMDVLLGLADRLAVMHHGRLLALDTPGAVTADPVVQRAYLGEGL
ncbi:ABC transporter ATP-binding protein, partial [Streptomyces sp. FT05W]